MAVLIRCHKTSLTRNKKKKIPELPYKNTIIWTWWSEYIRWMGKLHVFPTGLPWGTTLWLPVCFPWSQNPLEIGLKRKRVPSEGNQFIPHLKKENKMQMTVSCPESIHSFYWHCDMWCGCSLLMFGYVYGWSVLFRSVLISDNLHNNDHGQSHKLEIWSGKRHKLMWSTHKVLYKGCLVRVTAKLSATFCYLLGKYSRINALHDSVCISVHRC